MSEPAEEFLIDLHRQWQGGRSKNDIERVEFNDPYSHGKSITRMWRDIGLETERPHPMKAEVKSLRTENDRLRAMVEGLGGTP
jgi:hypothetical protein